MSDNKEKNTKAIDKKVLAPKKLQLTKTVESGPVQQTFARGRSKTVMVEVKKTRTFSRNGTGGMIADNGKKSTSNCKVSTVTEDIKIDDASGSLLTKKEKEVRLRALEQAEHTPLSSESLPPLPNIAPEPSDQPEEKKKEIIEKVAKKPEKPEIPPIVEVKETTTERHVQKKKEIHSKLKLGDKGKTERKTSAKRSKTKLTISNAFDQDDRIRSLASVKRARQKAKRQSDLGTGHSSEKSAREIIIPEMISVQELANRMAVRSHEVVKELMKLGVMASGDKEIDAETAELIVTEFGHKCKMVAESDVEDILKDDEVDEADLEPRAPVITVMGHVDHGKTSLLDALRSTSVTDGEAGGITQHIGAYQTKTGSGGLITFLDTPGHAAFTAMRSRGAKVTDIVILIVAADDGIMPQTVEAINHAKAAEVPIIVAINKIDKPGADSQKVRNELLAHELIPEELGGDIICIDISAQEKTNLDKLEEILLLQAEMLELKASPRQRAAGTVIEAKVDKNRGVLVTLLVQRGTLQIGDIVVAGTGFGRVKAINNDNGEEIVNAGPSTPVEILGFNELPAAGDEFSVVHVEKQAREIVEYRTKLQRDISAEPDEKMSIEKLFQTAQDGGKKELRVIVKGDVQGSVEAINASLDNLSNDEITVKVVHSGAGGITESDVTLADAVNAIILGFNVRANANVRSAETEMPADIRYYSVIYNLIDDMKAAVGGMMSPIIREAFLGNAEILEVFKITKSGKVAGCKVIEGMVKRGAGVRLVRDSVVIHEGKLKTLKRFKEDLQEVKEGYECGMAFENYEDIKAGDLIEAYEMIEEVRKL